MCSCRRPSVGRFGRWWLLVGMAAVLDRRRQLDPPRERQSLSIRRDKRADGRLTVGSGEDLERCPYAWSRFVHGAMICARSVMDNGGGPKSCPKVFYPRWRGALLLGGKASSRPCVSRACTGQSSCRRRCSDLLAEHAAARAHERACVCAPAAGAAGARGASRALCRARPSVENSALRGRPHRRHACSSAVRLG